MVPAFDLLFEEHHKYNSKEYSGESIYEWNIDGRSEYEMLNLFQEMVMATMAYKGRGNNDQQSCILLVSGFTGALRYWWDNSLDAITQESIINHVEIKQQEDEEGHVLNQMPAPLEDDTLQDLIQATFAYKYAFMIKEGGTSDFTL